MFSISVTIYDKGRKKVVTTGISNDALLEKYNQMTADGCHFTCEILRTGKIAQYISCDALETDIAIEITPPRDVDKAKAALAKMLSNYNGLPVKEDNKQ